MSESQFKSGKAEDPSQISQQLEDGKDALEDLKKRLQDEGADNSLLTDVESAFWNKWDKALEKYDPAHTSGAKFSTFLAAFTNFLHRDAKRQLARGPRHTSINELRPESDSGDSSAIEDSVLRDIAKERFDKEQTTLEDQEAIRSFFDTLATRQMSEHEQRAFCLLIEKLNLWLEDPQSDDLFDAWDRALFVRLVFRQSGHGEEPRATAQRTGSAQEFITIHALWTATRRADFWRYWASVGSANAPV